jgi:hypothetical protein
MADENEKTTNQEINGPSEGKRPELSKEELDEVTGGISSPRDPQSGLPTGQ